MRRSPSDEGRRWLERAEEDLRWAAALADLGAHHLACFLSQQVAGKAVEGFLYAQGEEVVLGHSVQRLCEAAAAYQQEFARRAERWGLLDSYDLTARYPNSLPDGIPAHVLTREAAAGAVCLAREAVEFVRDLLPMPD